MRKRISCMRLELEIPDELEAQLSAEAAKAGTEIESYVLKLLVGSQSQQKLQTGADLVEYWEREGIIGMRSDIVDSQKHARGLREQAQQRNLP
jgi:hypothetical protein